jgi:hypothetical protein
MLTLLSALRGIESRTASTGSCTIVVPPHNLIPRRPAVPSSSAPDRITPITAGPKASAAERNSGLGGCRFHADLAVSGCVYGADEQMPIGLRHINGAVADDVSRLGALSPQRSLRCQDFRKVAWIFGPNMHNNQDGRARSRVVDFARFASELRCRLPRRRSRLHCHS